MRRRTAIGLAALLLAAIPAGWWGYESYVESRAVETIESQGAAVTEPIPDVRIFIVDTGGPNAFGDSQLAKIIPFVDDVDRFAELDLRGSSVTDASMPKIIALSHLQRLNAGHTNITAAGLMQLRSLPGLRNLMVSSGQLSPSELTAVKAALPNVVVTEGR